MNFTGMNLIDRGDVYEIIGYKPIIILNNDGNPSSIIYCPYIPKFMLSKLLQIELNNKLDENCEN